MELIGLADSYRPALSLLNLNKHFPYKDLLNPEPFSYIYATKIYYYDQKTTTNISAMELLYHFSQSNRAGW